MELLTGLKVYTMLEGQVLRQEKCRELPLPIQEAINCSSRSKPAIFSRRGIVRQEGMADVFVEVQKASVVTPVSGTVQDFWIFSKTQSKMKPRRS